MTGPCIWLVLLVSFVTRESLSYSSWSVVARGTVGVVLVQQPQFQESSVAILVGLRGAFFGAIAVYNIHLLKKIHPTTIVAHFSMIASIVSFLAMVPSLCAAPREAAWTKQVFIALLGVGALGTVGQLAMTRGYMAGDPAIKAIVALAQAPKGFPSSSIPWAASRLKLVGENEGEGVSKCLRQTLDRRVMLSCC